METTLDLMRRLLARADDADLQSSCGKRRGFAVLHAGCTAKVSSRKSITRSPRPVDLDPRRWTVLHADAASGTRHAPGTDARADVAA